MKILFYVEPHPIRNSKTHFYDIAKNFSMIINGSTKVSMSNSLDMRLFSNDETIKKLKSEGKIASKYIIEPIREEIEIIDSFCLDWEDIGINIWLDLINGGEIAQHYIPILRRIYDLFPFDIIVYWGENGAIRAFQKEKKFTALAMELGCTRVPFMSSLIIDPFGTNGSAIVPKLDISDVQNIVNSSQLTADEAKILYSGVGILPYDMQFNSIDDKFLQSIPKDRKIVFLPLQLFDDANLIKFSPYSTLKEVVVDVVPRLVHAGYFVIIKPHPASKHRTGSDAANIQALEALNNYSKDILWCEEFKINNIQLIQLSDLIITVNSSVGFEALLYNKPCVILGDAVYKPKNMFPTLDDILAGYFDKEKFLNNAGYLRRFFFDFYLLQDELWTIPELFLDHIIKIHDRYQKNILDSGSITKYLHELYIGIDKYKKKSAFFVDRVTKESKRFKPIITNNNKFLYKQSEILIELSGAKNIDGFSKWLDKIFSSKRKLIRVFKEIGFVNINYYLMKNKDVANSNMDVYRHYVYHGIYEGRFPNEIINKALSIKELVGMFEKKAEEIFESAKLKRQIKLYPLTDIEYADRVKQLNHIRININNSKNSIVVIAHLYYKNLVPEILDRLSNIKEKFDLIITTPNWGFSEIKDEVSRKFPRALFYHCVNRGRDIGPFIDILPIILGENYKALLKIHTKNGFFHQNRIHLDYSKIWRTDMLDALIGSPGKVDQIIRSFTSDDSLNMVGAIPFMSPIKKYPYSDNGYYISNILKLKISPTEGVFCAGTMFWIRPNVLKPLIEVAGVSILSFSPEKGSNDGELAHILERAFAHLALENGKVGGMEAASTNELKIIDDVGEYDYSLLEYCEMRKNEINSDIRKMLSKEFSNQP